MSQPQKVNLQKILSTSNCLRPIKRSSGEATCASDALKSTSAPRGRLSRVATIFSPSTRSTAICGSVAGHGKCRWTQLMAAAGAVEAAVAAISSVKQASVTASAVRVVTDVLRGYPNWLSTIRTEVRGWSAPNGARRTVPWDQLISIQTLLLLHLSRRCLIEVSTPTQVID